MLSRRRNEELTQTNAKLIVETKTSAISIEQLQALVQQLRATLSASEAKSR